MLILPTHAGEGGVVTSSERYAVYNLKFNERSIIIASLCVREQLLHTEERPHVPIDKIFPDTERQHAKPSQ